MDKRNYILPFSFFVDFVIENDTIYFPMANYNAICKGCLSDDHTDIIDIFPDVSEGMRIASYGIYKHKEYLLFYRDNEEGILIYNTLQRKFSKLSNNKIIDFFSETVFERNNYIYIVSIRTAEIYKVNLQMNSIQCITCKEYASDNMDVGKISCNSDCIFISLNSEKVLLVFEFESEEFIYYRYPEKISCIHTLSYYNDKLWITGEDSRIYSWNIKEKESYMCAEVPDDVKPYILERIQFGYSFVNNDILWLFPLTTSTILKYNIITGDFEKLDILGEEENESTLKMKRFIEVKYGIVKKAGNRIFFISSKTRVLYELDLLTNNITKHCFPIANIYNGRLYPTSKTGSMLEENYFDLTDALMKSIAEQETNNQIEINETKTVGTIINEYIINNI